MWPIAGLATLSYLMDLSVGGGAMKPPFDVYRQGPINLTTGEAVLILKLMRNAYYFCIE
jgi:hypothetical protein